MRLVDEVVNTGWPTLEAKRHNGAMRGVLLDVGGVFLVPSRLRLIQALGDPFNGFSDTDFDRAHFEGMRALDAATGSQNQERAAYFDAYLSSLAVPRQRLASAIETLVPLWAGPSPDLWRQVLTGSIDGLRSLHEADLPLGIVSNSDGHVEEELERNRICQVGPGHGVPVLTVIDSGVVGISKPDPAIFDFALTILGVDPSEVVYVGDSVKYDVRSAEAAGLTPIHFDPYGLCRESDHSHIARVDDVLRSI
jgi:putative hydrolase of the HAD superfamily